MKLTAALFLMLGILSFSCDSQAEEIPKEMTGLEWLQASIGERMDCVIRAMMVLTQNGVDLKHTPKEYEDALEEKLRSRPELYAMDLTDILAKYIYEQEPSSRAALDKFRKKPEIKKIEMH